MSYSKCGGQEGMVGQGEESVFSVPWSTEARARMRVQY